MMLQSERSNGMTTLHIDCFSITDHRARGVSSVRVLRTTRPGETTMRCLSIYGRQFARAVPEDLVHRHIGCRWFNSSVPWTLVLPCVPRSPDFVLRDFTSFRTQVTS